MLTTRLAWACRSSHVTQHCRLLQQSTISLTSSPPAWLSILLRSYSSVQGDMFVVHPRQKSDQHLQEALRLAESFSGGPCRHVSVGSANAKYRSPATFFGQGTVESLKNALLASSPSRVFVNAALSGVQQRNLEAIWGLPVVDRVGLIIDIFSQRARTREARLQVELAALQYRSSRLVRSLDMVTGQRRGFGEGGQVEVVSARERGRSGSTAGGLGGAGGGGESELALQRQRVLGRRKALQKRLLEVRKTREVQRAGRRRSGKVVVAVVGYTNAGKSSLVSAFCGADVGVQDRLFATLDPTLRRALLPSGRDVILSDTVGFISDLPTQLIDAFRATLEEVVEADLILHVLDAASPTVLQQRHVVLQVLRELGVSERRLSSQLIEVWNKTDLLHTEQDPKSELSVLGSSQRAQEGPRVMHRESMNTAAELDKVLADLAGLRGSPAAIKASVVQKQGLDRVLMEIDRRVSVRCATAELTEGVVRLGRRGLSQPILPGPSTHKSPSSVWWASDRVAGDVVPPPHTQRPEHRQWLEHAGGDPLPPSVP